MLPSKQNFAPRHQQLIEKCYPRLPKNSTADAAPNSSELAYLLYYASTRQHKLPKVGAFLEKKTMSDVSHWQSARVHVTLQILTAMLEHAEIRRQQSFAILAPTVLRIIREVILHTNDIALMEATTSLWDVFTRYQDCLALAADAEYRALFDEVVSLYGTLAENNSKKMGKATQVVAQHDAVRIRKVGVMAFTSLFVPANAERGWNNRFDKAFAAVLSNLRSEHRESNISHLNLLRAEVNEEKERTKAANRRQSMAHNRTFSHDEPQPDPRAAEGTAQEADRLQEDEAGLLALECIEAIFQSDHPAQIRSGAIALMKFVDGESRRPSASTSIFQDLPLLFRLVTKWTTVQHRFIVLVIAVEHLYRLPVDGADAGNQSADNSSYLEPHGAVIEMINGVLRADDLNFIGLSVMDVMLRLLDHIIRLATIPTTSQTEQLIERMKDCIALLAVHVYYADQVRDQIAAILIRVKAYPMDNGRSFLNGHRAVLNESTGDTDVSAAVPSTARTKPGSTKSSSFTSDEARRVALEMVARIIEFANSTAKTASTVSNRHRVPIGVWEGTQWLLRDPSEEVRNAYRNALQVWARYESDEADETILDFEAENCIERLVEKARPAASISHSHQSHPQLLMLPYQADKRIGSSRNSSLGTAERKARVTAKDLDDIMSGKKTVPLRVQLDDTPDQAGPLDMQSVLATLKTASARPKREPVMSAPPY